jgi:hypothetical protein
MWHKGTMATTGTGANTGSGEMISIQVCGIYGTVIMTFW